MIHRSQFLSVIIFLLFVGTSFTHYQKGMILLDSFTFDKILSKFKATLVKFDGSHPYGDYENEFHAFAISTRFSPDLLVAEVGVQTYGDRENADLASRFGVEDEDFPTLKLFVVNEKEPLTFAGDFKEEEFNKFIAQHANVRFVLSRCLQEFDDLAETFMGEREPEQQTKIIEQAKELSKGLKNEVEKRSAALYIKIMQNVVENGTDYLHAEKKRVTNLKDANLNKTRNTEVHGRLNILQSFKIKDEL